MKKKNKEISFEEGLSRLDELVSALEDRTLTLDESLRAFEEGLILSRGLRQKLTEAEGKVELLMRDLNGQPVAQDFDPVDEAASDGE